MSTRDIGIDLTEPQEDFVLSDDKFPAFVAGLGAGKTEALFSRLILRKIQYPSLNVAYFSPTYDLIRKIAWPRIEEKADQYGFKIKLNKTENAFSLNFCKGLIYMVTMERPEKIVGFQVSDSFIDELDTLAMPHAEFAFRKIIERTRGKKPNGKPNTVAVATTPEGYRFVYDRWFKNPKKGYRIIKAPTYSNPYLPDDYVDTLKDAYNEKMLQAYIEGEFVNLATGSVYPDFDRQLNNCFTEIQPGEPLHVGVDFNVGNCTAIVCVMRGDEIHVVREYTGLRDTPAMAEELRKLRNQGHIVTCYPDASGAQGNSTNASLSSLQILKDAGLVVLAKSKNPRVVDRINAVNALICNSQGRRKLLVNVARCPTITDCLEQQAYTDKGEPDKKSGKDHAPDALGYEVVYLRPVVKPVSTSGIYVPHFSR